MDLLFVIFVIWGIVGAVNKSKDEKRRQANQRARMERQEQRGEDPAPYAATGRVQSGPKSGQPAQTSRAERPAAAQPARKEKRRGGVEDWIPAMNKKQSSAKDKDLSMAAQRMVQEKAAAKEAKLKEKAEKKAKAAAEAKRPPQGSITDYVSPEGPRHSERVTHMYGLDDCAPHEVIGRTIAEERDITDQLAQGMIWSQILGQPRSRQPYFGKSARQGGMAKGAVGQDMTYIDRCRQ